MNYRDERKRFLLRNLAKGLVWLLVIIVLFVIIKNYAGKDFTNWLKPVYERPFLVFSIFTVSEVVFGIIPPEIFMIWGCRNNHIPEYILIVTMLTTLSYLAGIIGFYFGRYLNKTRIYKYLRANYLGRYEDKLRIFGVYLIVVAALTPLPFSGICMLVGAVGYPTKKFFYFSTFRILRFIVYSWTIWQANAI